MTTPVTIRELVRCMWYQELCGNQKRSKTLRMHQNRWRLGLCPRPHWGSLQRSPRPPSWIQGVLLLRGGEGKGREGKIREGRRREGRGGEGLPRLKITSGYAFGDD